MVFCTHLYDCTTLGHNLDFANEMNPPPIHPHTLHAGPLVASTSEATTR